MGYLRDFLIGENYNVDAPIIDARDHNLPIIMVCSGADYVVNTIVTADDKTAVASVHDVSNTYILLLRTDTGVAFFCSPITRGRRPGVDTLIAQAVNANLRIHQLKEGQWRIFSDGQMWAPGDDGMAYEIIGID